MTKQAKPVSAATRAMLDAMEEDATAAPAQDKLDAVNKYVRELRDANMEKAAVEERLKAINITINDLEWTKIPEVMDEARLDNLTLAAEGNLPPFTVKVDDNYKANIPEAHAEEAFAYLSKNNSGDLIKTQYTISFGLGEAKAAERFQRSLDKANIQYETKRGVPWNTLTAWFKTEHKRKPLPVRAMEILGAKIQRQAKVVKQKEKK